MKASVILALLPAIGAFAAVLPQRDTAAAASTTTSPSATSSTIPCPTTPADCADRMNGHLVCLNSRTWCLYTDTTRFTPAFFPVELDNPCAPCLTSL